MYKRQAQTRGSHIVLFLPAGEGREWRTQLERRFAELNALWSRAEGRAPLHAGIGEVAADIEGLPRSYRQALDAELTAALAPVSDKGFVTFHHAYGYFTAHSGQKNAGFLTSGASSPPGAPKLQQLQIQLRAGGCICAFPELQHYPALLTHVLDCPLYQSCCV